MSYILKVCKCGQEFRQYNSVRDTKCYDCKKKCSKPPNLKLKSLYKPRRVSAKQEKLLEQYYAERKIFLALPENQICPVTGQQTTDVHHKRKRRGYADEWARLNNIPLLLDKRFWLAVSRAGHVQIEDSPEWAYEMGFSITNNTKN